MTPGAWIASSVRVPDNQRRVMFLQSVRQKNRFDWFIWIGYFSQARALWVPDADEMEKPRSECPWWAELPEPPSGVIAKGV